VKNIFAQYHLLCRINEREGLKKKPVIQSELRPFHKRAPPNGKRLK